MDKTNQKKSFVNAIAFERGNLVLGVITLLVGGYIGHLLPPLVQDPKNPSYWPLWLLVASCVLLVVGIGGFIIVVSRHKFESSAAVAKISAQAEKMEKSNAIIVGLVEQTVARQAALVPRDNIYKEMARAIENAKSDINLITYLVMDPQSGERNWLPALKDTPNREDFYNALYKAIFREDISYLRIWQTPQEKGEIALDAVLSDPLLKKEYELIDQYRKVNPHLAKFMIAPVITTMSFILIDDRELFLNVDLFNEETQKWESPFMLFIKDATGNAFEPLKGVIARLRPIETD